MLKKIFAMILGSFDWDSLVKIGLTELEKLIEAKYHIKVELSELELEPVFTKIEAELKDRLGIVVDLDNSGS